MKKIKQKEIIMNSITLMGHNGAGKTTLIYYLTGLLPDEKSHPFIKNFKNKVNKLTNKNIAYVPEISYLEGNLTALDYFNLFKSIKNDDNITLEEIFKKVELKAKPNQKLKEYSKGMKQRLLIGLSLIGNPDIIILDEPFSGLDIFGEKIVFEIIKELNKSKKLIICSHSPRLAIELKNEIWILKEGEIKIQKKYQKEEELIKDFTKNKPSLIK
jgi:ABC-type multidrug transport system ATPase subunit